MLNALLAVVAMLAAQVSAAKSGDDEFPRPRNAALAFWRAWSGEPGSLAQAMEPEFNGREPGWTPSERLNNELAADSVYVDALVGATALPECDWGVDYADVLGAPQPHIEKLRASDRVLVSDCRRLIVANDRARAATRIVALYRMAWLARDDRLTSMSGVALGFARMAADEIRRLPADFTFDGTALESLRAAASAIDGPDTFHYGRAIRLQGVILARHVTSHFQGPEAGKLFLREMARGGEPQEIVEKIPAMDGTALGGAADQVQVYYAELSKAWNDPKAADRIAALQQEVLNGARGPVAFLTASDFLGARRSADEHLAAVREAQDRLEKMRKHADAK